MNKYLIVGAIVVIVACIGMYLFMPKSLIDSARQPSTVPQAGDSAVIIDQTSLDSASNTRTISGTANTSSVLVNIYTSDNGRIDGNATPPNWYQGQPPAFVPVENGKWHITLPANLFPSENCWAYQLSVAANEDDPGIMSHTFSLCAQPS